jgi:predicted RND superfamily exporter protein
MTQESDAAAFGNRTELAFRRWGVWVVRHRWWAIALPLLLTLYMLTWLPLLVVDNSTEGFLHPDDPTVLRYNEFRDRFDRDDRVIMALAPPDVFDARFLEKLRLFHLALEEEVPYADEVTSLFNARSTRGEGDELIVEDLLEGWLDVWPDELGELAGLRERVLGNPLYINTLVSEGANLTTVTVKPLTYSLLGEEDALAGFATGDGAPDAEKPDFLTAPENDAMLGAILGVIERFEGPDFPIYLGGPLAITDHINRQLARDMGLFMSLAGAMILLLLFVLFRRISGALLPLAVVLLSVVASIGVMVALDIPGTTAVQILPVFLLTVGICDAVHILTITYQRLAVGDTKDDAIAYAIGHSGLAVVMTSITTAAGMASFISAEMAPISHLGTVAPIGVMLALAYTLVLLPGVLAVVPLRGPRANAEAPGGSRLARVLVAVGDFSATHPRGILLGTGLFVALSIAGASQVRFSHNALNWFDPDDPIRIAAEVIDQGLRGSMSLEVIIDAGEENGLHDPDLLRRIERAMQWAEGVSKAEGHEILFIGKAVSIVDVVKETHRALNENRPEMAVLPDDRQLIAQELLLFENGGADDLQELVDTDFGAARLSLRAPFVDALYYGPFVTEIEVGLREILGDDVEIEMTGFMPVLAGVVSAVIVSMGRSYVIALAVITPLMILLLRDLRLGLLSMIPNLIPVIFTLGIMGWLDFPLDATTIMVGAMVIGLAVDDTIHFMHKFRLYFARSGDARDAIRETLSSTGAALLFTTLVLAGGFFVMSFASMTNTRHFGILAGTATGVAFIADVVVAPALMALASGPSERRGGAVSEAASG